MGVLLIALTLAPCAHAAPLEVELDSLQPGLAAEYRSLTDATATLSRIDLKPAFTLGHSSPHPRLPPGPFAVAWDGILLLKEAAPVRFAALVCGEVTVEIDGVTVLQGRGERETARLEGKQGLDRPPGFYRLKIRYRSLPDLPARLQLHWEGPSFSRETLPAWQLKHIATELPAAFAAEQLAEQGRTAINRLGCARCHAAALPGTGETLPGPALGDLTQRVGRRWLLAWLDDPAKLHPQSPMPALFRSDRQGFVERSILADYLLGANAPDQQPERAAPGDHRLGRRAFLSIGCTACHFIPDVDRAEQGDFERRALRKLVDRLPAADLAAFIANPHGRYPDGRMPRLPVPPDTARDIAAYLLLAAKPTELPAPAAPPTADEIAAAGKRLGARNATGIAVALLRERRCLQCHPGLGPTLPVDVPLTDATRGCLADAPGAGPRYALDAPTRKAIARYLTLAGSDRHPAPFAARQRQLERAGCVRCHQGDSDRPPPLETISSTLGGAYLQNLPFQRTPKLTYAHQKYSRAHLLGAVRESVTGLRPARFSFRMPAFGTEAETLVQALAAADGELPAGVEPAPRAPADPTLGTLSGATLVGFTGYACVSCHVWNGQALSEADPGAVGTDLTRVVGRIRRDWFDRFLEDPARFHPNTPMPAVFPKGKPATLTTVLDGDAARQRDALWSYFTLGKAAPSPKPPPPLPVTSPTPSEPPLVAQIPVRLPGATTPIESICILFGSHDLVVYDVGAGALHSAYVGGQLLRNVQGRLRTFTVAGKPVGNGFGVNPAFQLLGGDRPEPGGVSLRGYDRLPDGVRLRWQVAFAMAAVEVAETVRLQEADGQRRVLREFVLGGVPANRTVEVRYQDGARVATAAAGRITHLLPAAVAPPPIERVPVTDAGKIEGSLERPGYRAIAYPRPKSSAGDDLLMPGAVAANPRDGRVFVASMKAGEIFVLRDPGDDGKSARFENYARGLYQEAYSMLAEPDALYVLHRRNLTRISESKNDGVADRFDRVAALPHGIGDTYDYGYGLVRDRSGAFVVSYAPYANTSLPGSGGAVRLTPGQKAQEIAYGFRNPVGWTAGPEGEVFYTDNQGEWVATNKLCHVVEGRFYGFPNSAQRQHASKPFGKTAVWVPYAWARSINGVTYDSTGGKFGPFAGQFFLAELMYGGAIVRAQVEKVNGEYQGACFPFWGRGLLGPVTLAFDPKGRLFVGSITEPGWMAQPDRGGLFRIDYTGQPPFEMQAIHVRPRGFRIVFTQPVDPRTAQEVAAYSIEHYRYEYSGAYGSPELDRTRVPVERVAVAADGKSVEVTLPLVKDRVYLIQPRGVKSASGAALVHPAGAYTLNEIPAQ